MRDEKGQIIELVQGNWHPHICVRWYATDDNNFIEVYYDKRAKNAGRTKKKNK